MSDSNITDEIAETFRNGEIPSDDQVDRLMDAFSEGEVDTVCPKCEESYPSDLMGRFDEGYFCEDCFEKKIEQSRFESADECYFARPSCKW